MPWAWFCCGTGTIVDNLTFSRPFWPCYCDSVPSSLVSDPKQQFNRFPSKHQLCPEDRLTVSSNLYFLPLHTGGLVGFFSITYMRWEGSSTFIILYNNTAYHYKKQFPPPLFLWRTHKTAVFKNSLKYCVISAIAESTWEFNALQSLITVTITTIITVRQWKLKDALTLSVLQYYFEKVYGNSRKPPSPDSYRLKYVLGGR